MNDPVKLLGPKWREILAASFHLSTFQILVAQHQLTGQDVAKGLKLLNVHEEVLEASGARV